MVMLALGAMAFAIFQPIQVLPRIRLAPGYAMVDQYGDSVTSEDGRGLITLYTFVPLGCGGTCERVDDTMRSVGRRVAGEVDLGGTEFRLVTVVLDPAADLVDVADAAGDAEWPWISGTAAQIENVVGLGFRRSPDPSEFTPSYAIVDGSGMIRGEYRYQTLADDADKLVRHIDVLGGELRNSSGLASFAYGAAHVFQCYP